MPRVNHKKITTAESSEQRRQCSNLSKQLRGTGGSELPLHSRMDHTCMGSVCVRSLHIAEESNQLLFKTLGFHKYDNSQ